MRMIVIALLMLFAAPDTAAADVITCQPHRPHHARAYWSWREVSGRRCWYVGSRRVSKGMLSWASAAARESEEVAAPPVETPSESVPQPPKPPPVLLFEERWWSNRDRMDRE